MKHNMKRVLSWALSLAMVLSLSAGMGLTAWAEEGGSLSDYILTLSTDTLVYTGSELTVSTTVKQKDAEGYPLMEGTDYTVSGNKATEVGTYTVTVTGQGDYSGTLTAAFSIVPADQAVSDLRVPEGGFEENVIYVQVPESWSRPYLYLWGENTPDYRGAWPGEAMTVADRETRLYQCSYPELINGDTAAFFLFSDNGDPQTSDWKVDRVTALGNVFIISEEKNESGYNKVTYVSRDAVSEEPVAAGSYSDVAPDAWYADSVSFVQKQGLMQGYGNGQFRPDAVTSRAMMAQILYNLKGKPMIRSGISFTDVTEEDWYAMAVYWADSRGIMQGYGSGLFGPGDEVTREQLVTTLYRYAQEEGAEVSAGADTAFQAFGDADSVSPWAVPAMTWAVNEGLVTGKTATMLQPKASATRAEIAAILTRYCESFGE